MWLAGWFWLIGGLVVVGWLWLVSWRVGVYMASGWLAGWLWLICL